MQVHLAGFQCTRCGHQWRPRSGVTPLRCASCKSPYWNRPRREKAPQGQRKSQEALDDEDLEWYEPVEPAGREEDEDPDWFEPVEQAEEEDDEDQEWYAPVEQEQYDRVIMTIKDYQGQIIRLTQRQWDHIIRRRSTIAGMLQSAIQGTLENPQTVRKDQDDPDTVRLYYRRYTNTPVGDKLICVAVKFLENDAFILTAFPTSRIKPGELTWPKEL